MKQYGRAQRVAELIKQEVAKLLQKGLKDPRLGFVSVMDVRMSPDLRYANVYVSLYGSDKERKSSLVALQRSSGWIRKSIGKHLRMRVLPEIRFFQDDTLDRVYKLEEVFEEIREEQRQAPMRHVTFTGLVQEFQAADAFLITSHVNPDGDGVGSMLALRQFLLDLGKRRIHLALSDPAPQLCRNLPGVASILTPNADTECPEYDLAVILDTSRLDRIGDTADWIDPSEKIAIIDHHLEDEPEGTFGVVDPAYAAVGEMIADLYQAAEMPLSKEAAHCAYVAQITDTGGYRFANTTPRSHRIAARLLEAGIDGAAICAEVFGTITRPQFELLRRTLSRMTLIADGRVAYAYLTEKDLEETGGIKEDTDGLVNYARNIEGVEVGMLFTAFQPGKTKVSLRSGPTFNSANFLANFGGGGHQAAAGALLEKPLEAARDEVCERLTAALKETV